jgi:hypothetical protein
VPGAAVAVVVDSKDHPSFTAAALDAHRPVTGRITVHPSPGASAPPALAQDILGGLGKILPAREVNAPRHRACWADTVQPAWTAAAAWTHAHRIGHLIILRSHTLTGTGWKQLGALQRRTGCRLTLIWHQQPDGRLKRRTAEIGTAYRVIDGCEAARTRFALTGPRRPEATQPSGRCSSGDPGAHGELIARIGQVGHPLHAGLLATQILLPDATAGQLTAVRLDDLGPTARALALPGPGGHRTDTRLRHPVPGWAEPLLTAARAWHYLTGHRHESRQLFQHDNFHHHNQLADVAAALGIRPAIDILDRDPAWPVAEAI